MKQLKVIVQIGILFVCYKIGVLIQHLFDLFIPGSVIGLILMVIVLMTGLLKLEFVESGAQFMNKHLVLFFIPATVGIMNHYKLFAGKGVLLIVITMLSTLCVMAVSGLISQMLTKKGEKGNA